MRSIFLSQININLKNLPGIPAEARCKFLRSYLDPYFAALDGRFLLHIRCTSLASLAEWPIRFQVPQVDCFQSFYLDGGVYERTPQI